jgi:hypothetical protein
LLGLSLLIDLAVQQFDFLWVFRRFSEVRYKRPTV